MEGLRCTPEALSAIGIAMIRLLKHGWKLAHVKPNTLFFWHDNRWQHGKRLSTVCISVGFNNEPIIYALGNRCVWKELRCPSVASDDFDSYKGVA